MSATVLAEPRRQPAPIPFIRLLRAEWLKTTGARAARWLLAAAALSTIAAEAIPLLFPHNVKQSSPSYLSWAGLGLTRLLPVVLILAMTAEWSQRTAMSSFTQEPRRGRVLAAKIAIGLGVSLLGACFALAVSQLVVVAAHAAGRDIATGGNWPQFAGAVAFILLTAAIGIAFGALLHNTAGAIVTYFALGAAFNLFTIPALEKAGHWVNAGETYGWVLNGEWSGHGAQIATSTVLWIVLPLTFGVVRTLGRDVR
jgi:ABC-2 type transport system permease protein